MAGRASCGWRDLIWVDDQLKFCRELNGQPRRLGAAQNAIDISGGATPSVYQVYSIGEQTA